MTTQGGWPKPLLVEIDLDEWGTKSKVIVGGVDVSDNVYKLEIEAQPQYLTCVTLEFRNVHVKGKARTLIDAGGKTDG